MKDVQAGKPVGRVQYFLNGVFKDLLEDGKVVEVKGWVYFSYATKFKFNFLSLVVQFAMHRF